MRSTASLAELLTTAALFSPFQPLMSSFSVPEKTMPPPVGEVVQELYEFSPANDGVWSRRKGLVAAGLALLYTSHGLARGVCGALKRESLQLLTLGFFASDAVRRPPHAVSCTALSFHDLSWSKVLFFAKKR